MPKTSVVDESIPLRCEELDKLARTPGYAAVQKKLNNRLSRPTSRSNSYREQLNFSKYLRSDSPAKLEPSDELENP